MLSPLIATCQHAVITQQQSLTQPPGSRADLPSIHALDFQDDLTALSSDFQNMNEKKRRAYFSQRLATHPSFRRTFSHD